MARQFHRAVPCSVLSVTVMTLSAVSCSLAVSWEIESAYTDGRPTSYVFAMDVPRTDQSIRPLLLDVVPGIRWNCQYVLGLFADDWHKLVGHFVKILKWKSLTVVYNSSDLLTSDTVLDSLSQLEIPLAVAEDTAALQRAILKKSRTFVVWGTTDDVTRALLQTSQVATHMMNFSSLLADTEWILAIASGNSRLMMKLLCEFRNVLILQNETGETGVCTLGHKSNGCQLLSLSPLLSSSYPVSRQDIYPYATLRDFGGQTLRVAIREYFYYIRYSTKIDGQTRVEGALVDVLQELSLTLNFSYTLVYSADNQSWGLDHGNGQWDGLMGMLIRNEADIAVGPLTMTPERSLVADHTAPHTYTTGGILFKTRDQRSGDPGLVWKPFRPLVYGVIGGCFLLVLSLLSVCELQQRLSTSSTGSQLQKPLNVLLNNVEVLLAGLTNRAPCKATKHRVVSRCGYRTRGCVTPVALCAGTEHEVLSRSGAVLVCSWVGLCVVLTSLYSGNLTSSLAVSDLGAPFTSLAELVAQDTYTWGFQSGTAQAFMLQTSKIPIYRQFYEGALKHAESDPEVLCPDANVAIRKIKNGGFAFFAGSKDAYHVLRGQDCAISFLTENHYRQLQVFYLQKHSPYTTAISEQIQFLYEGGLIQYWMNKWRPDGDGKCDVREKENVGSFHLKDLQEAFYLVVSGIAAASLTLALECLVLARKFPEHA